MGGGRERNRKGEGERNGGEKKGKRENRKRFLILPQVLREIACYDRSCVIKLLMSQRDVEVCV